MLTSIAPVIAAVADAAAAVGLVVNKAIALGADASADAWRHVLEFVGVS